MHGWLIQGLQLPHDKQRHVVLVPVGMDLLLVHSCCWGICPGPQGCNCAVQLTLTTALLLLLTLVDRGFVDKDCADVPPVILV